MRPHTELVAAAHHEAGHAVAVVTAFRDAAWLPHPPPPLPVRYVEITEDTPGQWTGNCVAFNIYSTKWPIECLAEPYRDLMERQIVIHLAGGIAEAISRGETRDPLSFAQAHCDMEDDLRRANKVLRDLYIVIGRNDRQRCAERAQALLTTHWRAVEALASALVEDRRIEGERVARIIDRA
jgi:hypothetical protein